MQSCSSLHVTTVTICPLSSIIFLPAYKLDGKGSNQILTKPNFHFHSSMSQYIKPEAFDTHFRKLSGFKSTLFRKLSGFKLAGLSMSGPSA
jgi:hypothetical protein